MPKNLIATAILGTALALAATPGAFAQADQQKAEKGETEQGMKCKMMEGQMGGMMKDPAQMAAMREARTAKLKTELGITEAQMGVWNAYAEALKAQPAKKMGMGMMGAKTKGTALEKMDARIERTEAKLAGMKAMKPVTEALYNALSDDQKKKADKLLGKRCGMM